MHNLDKDRGNADGNRKREGKLKLVIVVKLYAPTHLTIAFFYPTLNSAFARILRVADILAHPFFIYTFLILLSLIMNLHASRNAWVSPFASTTMNEHCALGPDMRRQLYVPIPNMMPSRKRVALRTINTVAVVQITSIRDDDATAGHFKALFASETPHTLAMEYLATMIHHTARRTLGFAMRAWCTGRMVRVACCNRWPEFRARQRIVLAKHFSATHTWALACYFDAINNIHVCENESKLHCDRFFVHSHHSIIVNMIYFGNKNISKDPGNKTPHYPTILLRSSQAPKRLFITYNG